jgi:hypothetical protein
MCARPRLARSVPDLAPEQDRRRDELATVPRPAVHSAGVRLDATTNQPKRLRARRSAAEARPRSASAEMSVIGVDGVPSTPTC